MRIESLWSRLWVGLWVRMANQRGQTLAEYGVLITVIAVVVVVAALALGGSISSLFNGASRKV
jgi:Flp pilus assembly pilin Flp